MADPRYWLVLVCCALAVAAFVRAKRGLRELARHADTDLPPAFALHLFYERVSGGGGA